MIQVSKRDVFNILELSPKGWERLHGESRSQNLNTPDKTWRKDEHFRPEYYL